MRLGKRVPQAHQSVTIRCNDAGDTTSAAAHQLLVCYSAQGVEKGTAGGRSGCPGR